jgi:uncharacterized protein (TIGR03382 family)
VEENLGHSVSGAGDVNGDGYDDIIIGAPGYNSGSLPYAGAAYVYHGSSSGVSSSASRTLTGVAVEEILGYSVSGAGDVNGDGYDDVIIGSPGYDSGSLPYAGAAFIHQGYADEDEDGIAADHDCDDTDASVGEPSDLAYADVDRDGYGAGGAVTVCPDAPGYAAVDGDCDDGNAAYNPGAAETDCADPADYNCDGSTAYADADADGWAACEDCDDALGTVHPGVEELCNGVDDDCDSTIDQDPTDGSTWYADADGDGYTDPELSLVSCDQPEGYAAATEEDCDDQDPGSFPGASEVPDDGVDQDCDGDDLVPDERGDTGKDEGKASGRACQTGGGGGSLAALGLLLVALLRRRAAWAGEVCRRISAARHPDGASAGGR